MIELNKIYCENCIETMARMPDDFLDLTVTSPPYDDMDENFNPIPKNGFREYNGYQWNFKAIARELFRVTKQGGVIIWVVNDPTTDGSESLASSLQKIYFRRVGFNIHDTMIFQASTLTLNHNRYEQDFEYTFVLSKGKPNTFNPIKIKNSYAGSTNRLNYGKDTDAKREKGDAMRWREGIIRIKDEKIKGNIWRYNIGYGHSTNDKIAFEHPAIFPEDLASDHIYSWSNEGDLIYDLFMGSGTVAKMAHLMKRRWIGSEISQEYVDLANKRIEPYLRQTMLEI